MSSGVQIEKYHIRIRKTVGEGWVKAQPSPANADEQGIVKGEGCICKIEKQVFEEISRNSEYSGE